MVIKTPLSTTDPIREQDDGCSLAGNVGKIIHSTLFHNFYLAFELVLYLRWLIELRNQLGITRQNFFPKKGQTQNPKMYTVLCALQPQNWNLV